jgi:WD40 repeat protein
MSDPNLPSGDWSWARPVAVPTFLVARKHGAELDRLPLSRPVVLLGRNSAMCHFALDHPSLSRQHAAVVHGGGGAFFVVDLNSSHGTFVGGARCATGARVPLSAPLVLGGSSREYTVEEGAAEASAAAVAEEAYDAAMPPPPPAAAARAAAAAAAAAATAAATGGGGGSGGGGAETRAEREAQIRACLASLTVPLPPFSAAAAGRGRGLGGSFGGEGEGNGGNDGGNDDGDDDDDDDDLGIVYYEDGTSGAASAAPATSGCVGAPAVRGPAPPPFSACAPPALPVSHAAPLSGHTKLVTCLAVDPGCGRLVTGSLDTTLRFFDFGAMDTGGRPFREATPLTDRAVTGVAWSPTGAQLGVATASPKLVVLTREGERVVVTCSGDPYVGDAAHTKGHKSATTCVAWGSVPGAAGCARLFSSAYDGTVRTWDVDCGARTAFKELTCADVLKFRALGGGAGARGGVTAFAVGDPAGGGGAAGAGSVWAGLEDGSLQFVCLRAPGYRYARVDGAARGAHASDVTCVALAPPGTHRAHAVATRAKDGRVALWDARRLGGGPTAVLTDVPTLADAAGVAWSPDGALLVGGVGGGESGRGGRALVWDVDALESAGAAPRAGGPAAVAARVVEGAAPLSCVAWPARLNQLICGAADGGVHVLYSPALSTKGALLFTARAARARVAEEDADGAAAVGDGAVFAPAAAENKRRRGAAGGGGGGGGARPEHAPPPPEAAAHPIFAKQTFTDAYLRAHPEVLRRNLRAEDPQAVLTGYEGRSAGFTAAYSRTQPTAVLAETTLEEELDAAAAARAAAAKRARGGQ